MLWRLAALWLVAQAATVQSADAQSGGAYRVGPKDLLAIKVFEAADLATEARVSDTGTISFPPVGEVMVAGLAVGQIEAELRTRLEERFLQRATVSVTLKEARSKPISVIGAVEKPGELGFSGRLTLLEALTAAGGLADGHADVIYVLRRADNGLSAQIAVPVHELLVKADPRYNVPIWANDLINVPATVEITVYCLGEVAQPGALVFRSTERLSLLAAIARAGGLSERASSKILIKRTDSGGRETETLVDYKRIVAGREPDFVLKAGDVVVVKESFF